MTPICNNLIFGRALALLSILPIALLALSSPKLAAEEQADPSPNILIILADDLGWNDVSYHGSEIRTPNIDRLAREGVELDRFYAQPTCSPTRATLMTGKSPKRLGVNRPISKTQEVGLPLNEKILPQYLNEAGYRSVMVGKWHLGHYTPDYLPHQRGFEYFYGLSSGAIGYWDHVANGAVDWQRNGKTVYEEGYATRLLIDDAIHQIDQHDPVQPLFLYLTLTAPHLPNEAPEETIAQYADIPDEKRRIHAAMVDELDQGIGRVVTALEQKGILDNTLIFFASDNGGLIPGGAEGFPRTIAELATRVFDRPIPISLLEFMAINTYDGASDNSPLAGAKGTVHEGAVRVPAAMWWPEKIKPRKHTEFMTVSDILPTLLAAAGVRQADIPPVRTASDTRETSIDGVNQWPALAYGEKASSPDYLVSGVAEGVALYRWPWKLKLLNDTGELYNLQNDPLEQNNIAEQQAEIFSAMTDTVNNWPSIPDSGIPIWKMIFQPKGVGGSEERMPWAEAAIENAKNSK